jgi:hypothetical protein
MQLAIAREDLTPIEIQRRAVEVGYPPVSAMISETIAKAWPERIGAKPRAAPPRNAPFLPATNRYAVGIAESRSRNQITW